MNDYQKLHAERLSKTYWMNARQLARENGHTLESAFQHDTEPASWVAMCTRCEGYLALDYFSEHGTQAYGLVTEGECPGAPPVPAAERREADTYLDPDSWTPAPPKTSPTIYSWNWVPARESVLDVVQPERLEIE